MPLALHKEYMYKQYVTIYILLHENETKPIFRINSNTAILQPIII